MLKELRSIYIDGYKCFSKGNYVGLEDIKQLNVLIGRNNSGKSSLLDLLSFAVDVNEFFNNKFSFQQLIIGFELTGEVIKRVFKSNTAGGSILGNHYTFGEGFIGKLFHLELIIEQQSYSGRKSFTGRYTAFKNEEFPIRQKEHWDRLANTIASQLSSILVLRLGAERNIVPEAEDKKQVLLSNGDGATNIINNFINLSTLDSKLVEQKLLTSLNEIIYPDAVFTDIVVQQVEYGENLYKWEIFLEEEGEKGRIPLSKSGSGLKTIILVLIQFLLMPVIHKKDPSEIIFALEELENNLHPSLQRSLFSFIYNWAIENKTTVFLTTHSHIPINMFSGLENASIVHLRNIDNNIVPKVTLNYQDSTSILQDLDVKASDLLQSNGIIWVEGPTDRMYINKWIEIFSNGKLKEGVQYQVVYYGGRLLSHFSAETEQEQGDLINLLLTNRNSAILIDSDKRSRNTPINNTKKRIKQEFEGIGTLAWITKGKEIENYIPQSAIESLYDKRINTEFTSYMNIKDYLEKLKRGTGISYERNKVAFAKKIMPFLTKEDLERTLDLKQKVKELISIINKWNN
ncbi:ATP-dependent nuclease [Cytobacillus oceanisediminis]|uniref:ATPase AAA-type core domain-containing protein n=1 Tax=Cytobacillus oceanisediminis TaxID=665099 RepID=A0ABX3CLE6_9BACI|nr:ATP-binding protein [Cytobacillus oceanisediminis]OHX42361.1 hypothetical protein BBV17_27575 [Cytobacillus oceanisediminis]